MSKLSKALQAAAGNSSADILAIEDVFSTYLYKGATTNPTDIVNGIDLAGEGGMVWVKVRSTTGAPVIIDTIRGATKYLETDRADVEQTFSAGYGFDGFTSTGVSSAANGNALVNSTPTYASWTFRKAPRFFDVVTYTGTGVARSISHNLGIAPGFIATFERTGAGGPHRCWHTSLGPTGYMPGLEQTAAAASSNSVFNGVSDTTFTIGSSASINESGIQYVAYLFAHDPLGPSGDGSDGLIACGSFNSGGSAAYVDVDLGWEPQWVLFKSSSASGDWYMFDTMRGIATGGNDQVLRANASSAESLFSGDYIDITSTGFRLTPTGWNSLVGPNVDLVYIAIRRGPMRQPTSGTEVFATEIGDGVSTKPALFSGFPVDAAFLKLKTGGDSLFGSRLQGPYYMQANLMNVETGDTGWTYDYMNGWYGGTARNSNYVSWMFRRAPGFFDVVAYEGDGLSTSTFNHNLGVTPELMIIKNRDDIRDWCVYHKDLGATYLMNLNSTAAAYQSGSYFPADPTETVFRPGNASATNRLGYSHIAYHFATLPGVSKVGSYTGNGSSQTINCGFTSGARFVLIKRTDSTGDWYVWDTARGIVAANDPHLSLNTTAAEVTTDDSIDPDNSGFIVNQVAATNINVSSASYIYLAIA